MNYSARVNAEEMQELAAGAVGAALTVIGDAPEHPCFNITILNDTDVTLVFGWYQSDGLLDRIALYSGGGITLDLQTNKKGMSGDLNWPSGRAVYVRQEDVPTTGKVYVTYFYGDK